MAKSLRPTIRDVAQAAQVSEPVVSTVLNGRTQTTIRVSQQTRERVQRVARELNYQPSIFGRSLAHQKSFVIGLLLSKINASLTADVVCGVQDIAGGRRYSPMVFIHDTPQHEAEEFERSIDRRVDALIVDTFDAPPDAANIERYQSLAKSGFPLVELFGNAIAGVPKVNIDFRSDGRRAAEHLLQQGHRRVALVIHERYQERDRHWASLEFFEGYRAAVQDAGVEPIIVEAPVVSNITQSLAYVQSGREAARTFLARHDAPTAAICFSSRRAVGFVRELQEAGRKVPNDVSVVGYYESEISMLNDPPLTAFQQPAFRAGQEAARIVFEMMEGKTGESSSVASELDVRQSVRSLG